MENILFKIGFGLFILVSFGDAWHDKWERATFFLVLAGIIWITDLSRKKIQRNVFQNCTVFLPPETEQESNSDNE